MAERKPTHLAPSEFIPDLDSCEGLGTSSEYAYYLGVVEGCPVTQIDCVGLNFPLRQDIFRPDPLHPNGPKRRIPVPGGLNKRINITHIQALRDCLKRMVIRFKDEPEQREERGTGKNTKDVFQRARRGKIVKIPTAAHVAQARADGVNVPTYVREPNDEPAVRYMYFQLCPDQNKPERGHDFSTIEETGIVWPDEIDAELESILS